MDSTLEQATWLRLTLLSGERARSTGGQIHESADTAGTKQGCPGVTGLRWSTELIRQGQHLLEAYYSDGSPDERRDAVIGAGGVCREVISAAQLEQPLTVLGVSQVQAAFPALSLEDALDAYEEQHRDQVEEDSGSRKDFFFWRFFYDHTCYTFRCDPEAYGGLIQVMRLPKSMFTMADFFCGAGHTAVAARMAGCTVCYGVDAASAAVSSFNANTADYPGAPFNPPGGGSARGLHCTVDALLADVQAGRAPGLHVDYMHFSPPCQDLSNQKQLVLRKFDGKNLMVTAQLIAALQPSFVTLEEVPGFIAQRFLPDNIHLYGTAKAMRAAQRRARRQQQQQSQAQTALSQSFGVPELPPCVGDVDDADSSAEDDEGDVSQGDLDAAEAELAAAQAATEDQDGIVRPFLLLVPRLLSLGYQVRMCLLNSAHYGVPQYRWRVFLFATKHGYELPDPPAARYKLPVGGNFVRPGFVNEDAVKDPTFMAKANGEATAWWGVLTAATDALMPENRDNGLLPHVTVAEAVGDLPPIMFSSSSSAGDSSGGSSSWHLAGLQDGSSNWQQLHQTAGTNSNSTGTSSALQQSSAAAAAAGGGVEQQGSALPPAGTLSDMLAQLREESEVAALEAEGRRKHSKDTVVYGLHCRTYQPEQGVLLYQLPPPVADLRPVSQYAQFCRSPHWAGQGLRDFNPGLLRDHVYSGSISSLTEGHEMVSLGAVSTVVGSVGGGTATTHMAEQRRSTLRERARFQGVPDWFTYCGRDEKAKHLQVGNAVPYLLAVEVAASVIKAATGQDGNRPGALVGPSLAGWGLSAAQLPRYQKWAEETEYRYVVEEPRAAMKHQLEEKEAQQRTPSRSGRRRSHTAGAASGAAGSEVRSDGDAAQQARGSKKRSHQQQQQAGEEQQQPAPQPSQQQQQQHDAEGGAGVSGQQQQQEQQQEQQEHPSARADKRSKPTRSVH